MIHYKPRIIFGEIEFCIERNGVERDRTVYYQIDPYIPATSTQPEEGGYPVITGWEPTGMPTMHSYGDWDQDEHDAIIRKIKMELSLEEYAA